MGRLDGFLTTPYSNRSVCEGSSFAARRAGHTPAASPVNASNPVEAPSTIGSAGDTSNSSDRISQAPAMAKGRPMGVGKLVFG